MVQVLHIDLIVLYVYHFILRRGWLRTVLVRTDDILDSWKAWVILDMFIDVLTVLDEVANLVVVYDAHTLGGVFGYLITTTLAIVYQLLVLHCDVEHVMTHIAKLHVCNINRLLFKWSTFVLYFFCVHVC